MKKSEFISELKSILEIDNEVVDETTQIQLTSLTLLVVIASIDENFNKQVASASLENVQSIADLITLIGSENFE